MLTRIAIEPTNNCNLNCEMCYSDNREHGFMDWDLFTKIVDEAAQIGIASIALCFGGEPTLHPRFSDMVDYISKYNIMIVMSSNGLLINTKIAKSIGNSSFRDLNISIHSGIDLKKLAMNIKLLLKHNINNVNIFGTYVKGEHTDKIVAEIIKYISPLIRVKANNPIRSDMKWEDGHKKGVPVCNKTNRYMPILWDGRVTSCCFDWQGKNSFGDVGADGILGTWGSQHCVTFRKNICAGKYSGICKTCSLWK